MTVGTRRFFSFGAVATGFVLVLVACSSIPNVTFSDDEGGVIPEGGTGDSIVIGCTPSGPEVCDDGIDNDCNGKTDCEDAACTAGFSCQDAPAGWTAVGFAGAARPACPAATTATDLKVTAGDGSATGTCACSCTSVGGSCTTGSWTVTYASDPACATALGTVTVPLSSGALCPTTATSPNVPANAFFKVTPPAPPASCTATGAGFGLADGRACQGARFGKCANAAQVCAPKPAAGFAACITKTGKDVCPNGFTKRNTAGTAATDSRVCNGCSCNGPAPCTGGGVDLYDNDSCNTNGSMRSGVEGITSTCGAQPDEAFTVKYFKARAPGGGGCVPASASGTPSGSASFTAGERTVCCK